MIPRRLRLTRRAFPSPSTGMRATSAHFLLTWGPSIQGGASAIVSKKTARRSVDRHLLKRRMLSVLRPYCRPDYFFVLYARTGSPTLSFQELKAELLELLVKTNGRINHS